MVARLLSPPPFAPETGLRRLAVLLGLALAGASLVLLVHLAQTPLRLDEDARAAVRRALACQEALKAMRQRLGIPLDPALDPARSGLIGEEYTDLTTSLGHLRAKQTSLNPQFAGLVVMWLKRAGVRAGDRVALACSGSFPALNLAALCACETLDLRPLVFSSVGASNYGANLPGFTWLDMEAELHRQGLLRTRSRYASLGGIVETGGGLDQTGLALGAAAIARHGADYVREGGPRGVAADVARRLALYCAEGRPRAFINVGGNLTSLGWVAEAARLDNGLLARLPACASPQRGLVFRLAEAGVPVIHLLNIERLAAANHLPIAPASLTAEFDRAAAREGQLLHLGVLLAAWLLLAAILSLPVFGWAAGRRVARRSPRRLGLGRIVQEALQPRHEAGRVRHLLDR